MQMSQFILANIVVPMELIKKMKWFLSLQQIVDGKCKFFATVQVTNRHKITENCT